MSKEVERLKTENSVFAANQCHAGYGDERGNHRCRYQDEVKRLEKEKRALCREIRDIFEGEGWDGADERIDRACRIGDEP